MAVYVYVMWGTWQSLFGHCTLWLHVSLGPTVLSKPSSNEKGSLKLLWWEQNPRSDLCRRWEQKSQVGPSRGFVSKMRTRNPRSRCVCFKGLLRGGSRLSGVPDLPPCQPGVKWTLVGSGLFYLSTVVNDNMPGPQHLMLPTWASCKLPSCVYVLSANTSASVLGTFCIHSAYSGSHHACVAEGNSCPQQPVFLWLYFWLYFFSCYLYPPSVHVIHLFHRRHLLHTVWPHFSPVTTMHFYYKNGTQSNVLFIFYLNQTVNFLVG